MKNDFEELHVIASAMFNITYSEDIKTIMHIICSMEKSVQEACKKQGIELHEDDKAVLFSVTISAIKLERERILSNELIANK